MDYPDKLRALADYLDEHPALQELYTFYDEPHEYLYAKDWDQFQEVISELGGFEKSGSAGSLTARHVERDDDMLKYENTFVVSVTVSGVCEQVPKVDEDGAPVMKKKRVWVDTEEEEPDMEWKCPPVWTT